MIRVQLVVTGQVERAALHASLDRACRLLVPAGDFVFLESQHVESFTSGDRTLPPPLPDTPGKVSPARKLADAVIAALVEGRKRNERPDFVFAVDDLEVPNVGNAATVVNYFSTHMERALNVWFGDSRADRKCRDRVRERTSFHLLAPMLEAYFFNVDRVLHAAGATRQSMFAPESDDLEDFFAADGAYDRWCQDKPKPASWYRCHPKWYLKYLCSPGRYRETHEGKAALDTLSWRETLRSPAFARFARSLLDDLLEALEPGAGLAIKGVRHPLTERRPGRFLRNIDAAV